MPDVRLPERIRKEKRRTPRPCPAHRAWVRRHHCSVPDCDRLQIECAHVRVEIDGGVALKASDAWVISLCAYHQMEQHRLGGRAFERLYKIDLNELAAEFARRSPHRQKLNLARSALPTKPRQRLVESAGSTARQFNVGPEGALDVNLTALTVEGQFLALAALSLWSDVMGVTFREVRSGGHITFEDQDDDLDPGAWSTSTTTLTRNAYFLIVG